MSDCDKTDARPEESMHAYHSVWMAHWKQTSCESASGVDKHFSFDDEKKKDGHDNKQASVLVRADEPRKDTRLDVIKASPSNFSKHGSAWRCPGGLQIESDGPQSAKVGALTETERVKMRNEALSMKSLNFSNVGKWQSFPVSNFDERKKSILTSKNDLSFNGRHQPISQIDDRSEFGTNSVHENEAHLSLRVLASAPTGVKCLWRAHHPAEGVSQSSGDLVTPYESPEKKNFPVSRTLQENHTASISNFLLYGFETRGLPIQSYEGRNRKNNPLTSNECITKSNCATREHATYSGSSPLEENCESQQLRDPSTSEVRFPIFIGKQGKRCNFPGSEFLPSHSCPPAVTKSEELNYGSHSLRRWTTGNSAEALPQRPPKVSQANNHLLLSEGCKMLRESTVSTEHKGNAFYELLTLPPDFRHDTNLGAKLQSQRNSGATDVTGDVWNAKPSSEGLKNELSAEADAMTVDVFQANNLLPGAASYLSKKDVCRRNAELQATMNLLRKKVEKGKAVVDLPDMNQEPPASAKGDGMGDGKLSSSRTESLEAEHLLSLGKQPGSSTFSPHQDSHQCLEPDRRRVKSIKLNASDSLPHGTKYLKMGEASTSGKANNSKIMNDSTSISQDMMVKNFGKGKMNSKTFEECSDLTYSWIRRWCHNKTAAQLVKRGGNQVCEPQSSKAALYELEKKQFPSIGAMALMGKAMNGYRPCVFRRKGPLVVWNT
ncbi:uncharacterized protein LOC122658150 [Telopea speciosissima]|uniref:uncharacterized protein LOC122658150 n=1 Tax=Telopea speciosissima TaxID=54955 RepID=UPI001CC5E91F|nr:uncharacterized protein LOC122658150 [Telopea speciosissima]